MDTLNPNQPPSTTPVDPMDKLSPVPSATPTPAPQIPATAVPPMNNNEVENITVGRKRSHGPLIVLVSLFIVLLLLAGSAAFLGLVAYGKVDLNNDELERKISFAVQELPFTPKTGEFLIYKAMDAQKDLKSAYIDLSMSLKGSGPEVIPGLGNQFDIKVEGPIDVHDEDNVEAQIHLQMTPEVDLDFVSVNDKIFFKINEIPAVIKGLAAGTGLSFDTFLYKWISYDLKSLESDAKDLLDEDSSERDDEQYNRVKTALLNSSVVDKIVVTETDLDGVSVYKMSLELTSEEYTNFVNEISKAIDPDAYVSDLSVGTSYSQEFEDLKINTYIDKASMHTVKSEISFRLRTGDFEVPSQVLGASTIQYFPNVYTQAAGNDDQYMDVAVVVNGSRFNEDFDVKEPEGATPLETVLEEYSKQMMQMYESDYDSLAPVDDSSGFGSPDEDSSGFE